MENMKDSTTAAIIESGDTATRESRSPLENMQMELHQKGAILTKAWSDLFTFLTKYQGELIVKENSLEIAEKELEMRRKQSDDMKPATVGTSSDEISKLRNDAVTKESLLNRIQSELSTKDKMLRQLQSDLSSNMVRLESAESELLNKQSEVMRHKSSHEQLKLALNFKEEEIAIKDNLLKKLENQLMQENTELKEQLEKERRTCEEKSQSLQIERRAHEATKRTLLEKMNSTSKSVIEVPDSPLTVDLTMEQADIGHTSSISYSHSSQDSEVQGRLDSSQRNNSPVPSSFSRDSSPWASASQLQSTTSPSRFSAASSLSETAAKLPFLLPPNIATTSTSDVFFPLTVSPQDTKIGIVNSGLNDTEMTEPGQISGPIPSSSRDSPVSKLGQFDSLSQGGNLEGSGNEKFDDVQFRRNAAILHELSAETISEPGSCRCSLCGKTFVGKTYLDIHKRSHTGERPYECNFCHKRFTQSPHLKTHLRIHTGEKPFKCSICGRAFSDSSACRRHKFLSCMKKTVR